MFSRHVRQGRQQTIVRRLEDGIFFRIIRPGSRVVQNHIDLFRGTQQVRVDASDDRVRDW
jgi:hypothetical protein